MIPAVITSYGYGSSPLPGVLCSWHFATTGSQKIGIYFTDISVGYVINVEDGYGNLVASVGDDSNLPKAIVSPGNVVTMFHSAANDAPMGKHGFKAVLLQY